MFSVNRNPSAHDLTQFGRAMVVGFTVIGALAWGGPWLAGLWRGDGSADALAWRGAGGQIAAIALAASGVSLWVLSIVAPRLAKTVYVGWMSVTVPVGMVMGTVMLTLVFVLVLPVFSMIVRCGDPMRKRLTGSGSYWESAKPFEATLERMRRLF